jgi:hypothetical protein
LGRLNGVNPEAWLGDVLARIADGHPINRMKSYCHETGPGGPAAGEHLCEHGHGN